MVVNTNMRKNNLWTRIVNPYCPSIRQNSVGAYSQKLEVYVILDMQVCPRDELWTDLGTTISEWHSNDEQIIFMGYWNSEA